MKKVWRKKLLIMSLSIQQRVGTITWEDFVNHTLLTSFIYLLLSRDLFLDLKVMHLNSPSQWSVNE